MHVTHVMYSLWLFVALILPQLHRTGAGPCQDQPQTRPFHGRLWSEASMRRGSMVWG